MIFQDSFLKSEMQNPLQVKLPCSSCNADCCGPVPMTKEKTIEIFKKYGKNKDFKKRFPWPEKSLHKNLVFKSMSIPGVLILGYKHNSNLRKIGFKEDDYIFKKDKNTGGCLIYEDRPEICKSFGLINSLQCPYNGLDKQPDDLEERKRLVIEYQLKGRDNLLLAHKTGKLNEVANKYRESIK